MTTIFFFFCKRDLKAETAFALSPLNGCLILILWTSFEDAGQIDFFDLTTREGFSGSARLWLSSLFLAVLHLDMVEDSLQSWQSPV